MYIAGLKSFFGKKEPTRHFVSYPKSGRTWVRYTLRLLEADQKFRFHHDGHEFNDGSRPSLDTDIQRRLSQYSNVDRIVYMERDPRDVMVSLYHQVTGRFGDIFQYEGTMSEFVRDPYFGAESLRRFRDMWHEIARKRSVLAIRYEDMKAAPESTISTILDYAEISRDAAWIEKSCQESEIDKMRAAEKGRMVQEGWLQPKNGYTKVRKGRVGGHREEMEDRDIAYLDSIFGPY